MNKLFRNSAINIVFRILTALSLAVILILISRAFGPEGKGIFAMLYFIPLLAFNLGHLGIGNANVYYVSKNSENTEKTLFNSIMEGLILGIIFVLLFFIVARIYPALLYGKLNSYYIWLALLSIPFLFWERFLQGIFVGKQEFGFFNIATFLNKILIISVLVLEIYVWKVNIQNIALSYTIISITLPLVFLLYLTFFQKNIWRFNWELFKNTLNLGFRSFLACLLSFLVIRSDIFMVNILKGIGDVGLYSLAVNFADEILLIASSISLALFPHITEDSDNALAKTLRTTRMLSLLLVLLLGISVLLAKPLILYFFGQSFLLSLTSFYVLAVAIYFLSICTVLSQFFASKGFPWKAILVWFPGLIINIVLNIIFIPRFGIVAAAISSLIAYYLSFILYYYLLQDYSRITIREILVPKKEEIMGLKFYLFKK